MSDKIDLVYDLVKEIDSRQREKSDKDIARHAKEDEWRKSVDTKLEQHSKAHERTDVRLDKLETPAKAFAFLQSKTGKASAVITFVTSIGFSIYRMLI